MTSVLEYAVKRGLSAVPVLVFVSFAIVVLIRLVPGDPVIVMLGTDADPAQVERARASMGLDQPVYVQYVDYMSDVLRGDMGESVMTGESVTGAIAQRLPITLMLTFGGFVVSVLIAIPAGIISALNQNTRADYAALTFGLLGVSIPNFWLGIILLHVFAVGMGWFPVVGYVSPLDDPVESLRFFVLPSVTLGTAMAAIVTRMLRAELLEEIRMDYPDAIRMKGVGRLTVIRHMTKNAFIPVITVMGLQIGSLLGGSVVIEIVFSIPGIGRLLIDSIHARDYVMFQGVILVYITIFIVINAVVDVTYFYFDPKIKERN